MIKAEVIVNGTSDNIEFEGTIVDLTKELAFLISVMARRFYVSNGLGALITFRELLKHYIEDESLWKLITELEDDEDEFEEVDE